jgi:hypothetical protein
VWLVEGFVCALKRVGFFGLENTVSQAELLKNNFSKPTKGGESYAIFLLISIDI